VKGLPFLLRSSSGHAQACTLKKMSFLELQVIFNLKDKINCEDGNGKAIFI